MVSILNPFKPRYLSHYLSFIRLYDLSETNLHVQVGRLDRDFEYSGFFSLCDCSKSMTFQKSMLYPTESLLNIVSFRESVLSDILVHQREK